MVLKYRAVTLLVTGDLEYDSLALSVVPKVFPLGHGVIRALRHRGVSFQHDGRKQQSLAQVVLKIQVESLSSFIGVDGKTRR